MTILWNFSVSINENYHAITGLHSRVKSQDTSQGFQEVSVFPKSRYEMQKKK